MKVWRTSAGFVAERNRESHFIRIVWNDLFREKDVLGVVGSAFDQDETFDGAPTIFAPIDAQEVWAAGVTYFRSRSARMEESKGAGGGDFYDRVYNADRPELFFKATPHRVVGPGEPIRIRSDSNWNVPE